MGRHAKVTIRRGGDFIAIHDDALCREFLFGKTVDAAAARADGTVNPIDHVDVDMGNAGVKRDNRKKRSRKSKKALALEGTRTAEVDGLPAAEVVSTGTIPTGGKVLVARGSRERSPPPRRIAEPTLEPFLVGARVTFLGLKSRPELRGVTGTVHSFDGASGRVAVAIDGSKEVIKVQPTNLRTSIFG